MRRSRPLRLASPHRMCGGVGLHEHHNRHRSALPPGRHRAFLARSVGEIPVILADGIGGVPIDQSNVRQISLPGQSLPDLRGAALAAAETEAIAFVDPDCRLDRQWPTAAHRAIAEYPAVCGPVDYAGGRSIVSWAAFLAEYGAFVPPSSATAGVAGTNLIVRRSLLEQGGPFWKDKAVDRLRERGTTIHYVPELLVHHRRPWRLLPCRRSSAPGPLLRRTAQEGQGRASWSRGRCPAQRRRLVWQAGSLVLAEAPTTSGALSSPRRWCSSSCSLGQPVRRSAIFRVPATVADTVEEL
ncbi:MAG: hypothetical protein U0556_07340 [Dehalococcoidia bacterium]